MAILYINHTYIYKNNNSGLQVSLESILFHYKMRPYTFRDIYTIEQIPTVDILYILIYAYNINHPRMEKYKSFNECLEKWLIQEI